MKKTEPLQYGQYYHIYNRGINGEVLFRGPENYEYFLRLYQKYVQSQVETYAWCLMGNHFHFLVRIKTPVRVLNPDRGKPHLCFSHMFNAYTQSYNKLYSRHGSLFERPFKRLRIENEDYLRQVVMYIHDNPMHHGICDHPDAYPWSSYSDFITGKYEVRKNLKLEYNGLLTNEGGKKEDESEMDQINKILGL